MSEEHSKHSTSEKEKGFLQGLGKVTLLVFTLGIGYIILDKMGIATTTQSEETTWHDENYKPDRDYDAFVKVKKRQAREEEKFEREAEKILAQFIKDKSGKEKISSDDRKFLDDVSQKLKIKNKAQNSSDFISFMQNSFKFYTAMKSIGKTEESRSSKWMDKLLNQNTESLDSFAKQNPNAKEWMEFLEN